MRRVPVAGPWITDHELDAVAHAARTAWYEDAGSIHPPFERDFAAHVGRSHAISLPSCTSALHLALVASGVGPGDEVLVPELTWIASSAPVSYVGAEPVFVDVDERTLCLSVESVAAAISERTRAVIAVDLYGNMPAYHELEPLLAERGIVLIEDAAQAIGSTLRGKPAGAFGAAGTFSFHGSKTLTTGEGGMLVADDEELVARALVLRDHGRRPGDVSFCNAEVGFKYKMSALQAALGHAQLDRVDALVGKKRQIFEWYRERLVELDGVRLNEAGEGVEDSVWMTCVHLEPGLGIDKDDLGARLAEHGVDTRPIFRPLSSLPAYAGTEAAKEALERNPVAYARAPWGVNVPSALRLEEGDVDRVCRALATVLGRSTGARGRGHDPRHGSTDEEGEAFDRRVEERLAAGFVPDLRRAAPTDYFYKSFWRRPRYVSHYLGHVVSTYLAALDRHAPDGATVLDVGCGAGYVSLELAREGYDVLGVDVSRASIRAARDAARANPFLDGFGQLEYRHAGFDDVEGAYDVILFSGSLHHFPDVGRVIDRAHAMLRPDGLLLCYEPVHESFGEGDAAQVALIRSLLALTGHWYQAPEELGLPAPEDDPERAVAGVMGALERLVESTHTEYVTERDPDEPGGQSPNDLSSTGAQILSELRGRFSELEYRPMVSYLHRMLGGLRGEDGETARIADFLTAYDRLALERGILRPNCFFYVGRRRSS